MRAIDFVLVAVALCHSTFAFSFIDTGKKRLSSVCISAERDSRRDFLVRTGSATIAVANGLGSGILTPLPANAVRGAEKVNAKLKS